MFAGSFAAGALGAMVGLVLGTLRLPLVVLLADTPSAAAGTNIAISAASAAAGAAGHVAAGRVSWRMVAWMGPPSVAGAAVGALLGHRVPEAALFVAISAVLAWNGLELILRPFRERAAADEGGGAAAAVGFGFAIGLLGGAIGVILGTLRMPVLLRALRLTAHRAVGTNLVVGAGLGIVGFAAHALRLEVEWGLLGAGLAGALPGGWIGARATGLLSETALRRAIGGALVVVAVAFLVQAVLRL